MNELESLLNYLETTSLEPHDDYTSEFSYKEQKKLWRYIKGLQKENQQLKEQLERIEKARKEAIELINKVINMRKNGYSYEQYKKHLDEALKELDIDKGE